jgi:phosphoribosylamine-glycine ligase
MKIYCPEFTLASSVVKNIIDSSEHELSDLENCDFGINFLKFGQPSAKIFSINPETAWLETNKAQAYEFFKSLDIAVPQFKYWNKHQSYTAPYVVKFITSSSLGTQTVVVKDQSDLVTLNRAAVVYGETALVQQYVSGREFTVTVLVGEKNWVLVGTAQDYKTLESNININTFGMGSISPVDSHKGVVAVIDKVVAGLVHKGMPYKGFLSFQFIENESLWLLECNVRLCMPEFQSMSKLLDSNQFLTAIYSAHSGQIIDPLCFKDINSVTVNLIHSEFPNGKPLDIKFPKTSLEVITDKSTGNWCNHTFIAGVNNFGQASFKDLSKAIYQYLDSIKDQRSFYRKIIPQ